MGRGEKAVPGGSLSPQLRLDFSGPASAPSPPEQLLEVGQPRGSNAGHHAPFLQTSGCPRSACPLHAGDEWLEAGGALGLGVGELPLAPACSSSCPFLSSCWEATVI